MAAHRVGGVADLIAVAPPDDEIALFLFVYGKAASSRFSSQISKIECDFLDRSINHLHIRKRDFEFGLPDLLAILLKNGAG